MPIQYELEEYAKTIKVTQYTSDQLDDAANAYLALEKRAVQKEEYDVVLVAANSIYNLKSAYPNYFADSDEFLININKVISIQSH